MRKAAAANLIQVGEQAVPALRKVLASSPTLEMRKRIEELLEKLTGGTLSTAQLRLVRAVEVLERIGTPEAREVLRTLAQGRPEPCRRRKLKPPSPEVVRQWFVTRMGDLGPLNRSWFDDKPSMVGSESGRDLPNPRARRAGGG